MHVKSRVMAGAGSLPAGGRCTCFKVRRLARQLTALYDDALAGSGLTVTQYAALSTLARAEGPLPVARLARVLGMDRTTTSRLVNPLERDGLLARADCVQAGVDARARPLVITGEGKRRLRAAIPGWELAQREVARLLGHELDASLRSVADAANRRFGAARECTVRARPQIPKGHR
jgi:DNA-binding MarR family transcriptional regulator